MAIYQTELQDGDCHIVVQTDGQNKGEATRKIVQMLQKHEFKISKLKIEKLSN